MGKVARYKEKYKSRVCIRRLFLVMITVRVFNRDSEKILLVSYLQIGDLAISSYIQLALTQETAKPFLDN